MAFEQFLDSSVTFEVSKGFINIITNENKLDSFYPYEPVECKNPLEVAIAYCKIGLFKIDIENAIHILIAGASGAGKSVLLRAIILSFILTKNLKKVQLELVDFQKVELHIFKNCKMVNSFCSTPDEFSDLLHRLSEENQRRIDLFTKEMVVNVQGYNAKVKNKLKYIVCVIDEFAILAEHKQILSDFKTRIATDRKVGIHYIVCTQRPSVDIISGTIKTNIPYRICLKMATETDSRVVLDEGGAERLRGKGNAIVKGLEMEEIQAMYISEEDAFNMIQPFCEEKIKLSVKSIAIVGGMPNVNAKRQRNAPLYRKF